METKLYQKFKDQFRSMLSIMITLVLIVSAIWVTSLLCYLDKITIPIISINVDFPTLFFVSILEVAILVVPPILLSPFLHDYQLIKKQTYKSTEIAVIYFNYVESGTEPSTTYCYPIYKDLQTGNEIKVDLDRDVEYEGKYLIYYLPKTKIGVIAKKL